jgi:hypothetical protein
MYRSKAHVPIIKWSIDWVEELRAKLHGNAMCRKRPPLPPLGFDVQLPENFLYAVLALDGLVSITASKVFPLRH